VASADALLIATPEYNGSVPGVLKNALDWLSRGGPDSVLRNKPTTMLGAGGRFGSLRAQLHLREILTSSGSDLVSAPQVMIDAAPTRFDEQGQLTEERYRKQISGLLQALSEKVAATR
jgi:chromate reductase